MQSTFNVQHWCLLGVEGFVYCADYQCKVDLTDLLMVRVGTRGREICDIRGVYTLCSRMLVRVILLV